MKPYLPRLSRRKGRRNRETFGSRAFQLETLESRVVLSASSALDGLLAQPNLNLLGVTNSTPQGYTPSQIRQAYSFNGISFSNGTVQGNGAGQTIAIVDAYDDPNIASDLHIFDQTFGIADPPSFSKLNQNGGTTLPAASASWSEEIALDVEWAHAMAPGAKIVLVEANSSSLSDLLAAVNVARNISGVSVVSMSWGSSEFASEKQYDQYFTTPAGHTGITFVASAGDSGAQATWPAISPNVVSVGGTSLSVSSGSYSSESAWNGSGGGYSSYESEPSYQQSVQSSGARTSPDVSYNANPNTGVAVYDSVAVSGRSGWFEIGGTSAGAPQWAALIAIVDQGRSLSGQGSLAGGQSALYSLPSTAFHDVTAGSNGYSAKQGYDLVTGRGTPIASTVVSDLVSNVAVSSTTPTPTTPTTPSAPTSTSTSTPAPTHHTYYEIIYWNHRYWLVQITSNAIDAATDASGDLAQVSTAISVSATANIATTESAGSASQVPVTASSQSVSVGDTTPKSMQFVAPVVGRGLGSSLSEVNQDESSDSGPNDAPTETGSDPLDISTSASDSTVRSGSSTRLVTSDGSQPSTLRANLAMTLFTEPAFDACFASDSWALETEDFLAGLPSQIAGSWDLDLSIAVIGVALAVNFSDKSAAERPQPFKSRCRVRQSVARV